MEVSDNGNELSIARADITRHDCFDVLCQVACYDVKLTNDTRTSY
jgi:hypothetical protein